MCEKYLYENYPYENYLCENYLYENYLCEALSMAKFAQTVAGANMFSVIFVSAQEPHISFPSQIFQGLHKSAFGGAD